MSSNPIRYEPRMERASIVEMEYVSWATSWPYSLATSLAVLVARAVECVEAEVKAYIEERRTPDGVEESGGGGAARRDGEDAETDRQSERLGASDGDLLEDLVLS
eukprot:scaffold9442_cov33-Tisochrysis_lutea.AAC.2